MRCAGQTMRHIDERREHGRSARFLRVVATIVTSLVIASAAADAFAQTRGHVPRDRRRITFNGGPLDERGWRLLEQFEARGGPRLPDGNYWYDARYNRAVGVHSPAAWRPPASAGLRRGERPPDGSVRERTRIAPVRRARADRPLRSGVAGPVVGQRTWLLRTGRRPRHW